MEIEDVEQLTFEQQLEMAMIQSQLEIMLQDNFGRPDDGGGRGVSDVVKRRWERFKKKKTKKDQPDKKVDGSMFEIKDGIGTSSSSSSKERADGIGRAGCDDDKEEENEGRQQQEPHCSICLEEYEDYETLIRLPCGHIFHEDCILAWCMNHTRCPLCNVDLESIPCVGVAAGETTTTIPTV